MQRHVSLLIGLLCTPLLYAEEVLLRDGTLVQATLKWDKPQFQLLSDGKRIDLEKVESVRWKGTSPSLAAGLRLVVNLERGERIVGEAIRLDEKALYLRPTWGEPLAIPRAAIARLSHLPGWQPVLYEPFQSPGKEWSGKPTFRDGQMLLGREPARLKITPLAAGQISFQAVPSRLKEGTAGYELSFSQEGKQRTLKIDWSGPEETIAVRSEVTPELTGNIRRTGKPQRLTIDFSAERLAIDLDGTLLWNQKAGSGELQEIAFQRTAGEEPVTIDHLLITKPVPVVLPRDWADLTRDAIRSARGGFETFGQFTAIEPEGIRWKLGNSSHLNRWAGSSEWNFARRPVSEQETSGEQVELRLRSGDGLTDQLTGAIHDWKEQTVKLAHPLLGILTLPHERIEAIKFLYFGRHLPLEGTPHHLGRRPAFGFAHPQPDAKLWRKKLTFVEIPVRTTLVVAAAQIQASGAPVTLRVNQKEAATLNRLAGRGGQAVQLYRFENLPWRKGENEIAIEVFADSEERMQEVDLRKVWLEVSQPRTRNFP